MAGFWKFRYIITYSRVNDKDAGPLLLEEVISTDTVLPVGESWKRAREMAGKNRKVEKIIKECIVWGEEVEKPVYEASPEHQQ